jgi:choline dehydrogenase-like flavoprotein
MDTPPRIDPQFLADPQDLEDMVWGFKQARHLMTRPALARHMVKDLFTAEVHTDNDIREVLRQRCDTVYHPVGTCRMGPEGDPFAVVDAQLRVHGLDGLRIVDASVMPRIPGGNTNAPTVMVAEKAADLIRGARRLPAVAAEDLRPLQPQRACAPLP